MNPASPHFEFQQGVLTLNAEAWHASIIQYLKPYFKYHHRSQTYQCPAMCYGQIILALYRNKIPYQDQAKQFQKQQFNLKHRKPPRPYQNQALQSWVEHDKRGCVVLPTGAGKSYLAFLAIEKVQRDTLICVPTIDLMQQWASELETSFDTKIGMLGGGFRDIQSITVSTYDSALLTIKDLGNRFGFLIADECHHLPSPNTQQIARMSIAPFRLGLSATPERNDGGDKALNDLLGPIIYTQDIHELKGKYLSEYQTKQVMVPLNESEHREYKTARKCFSDFLKKHQIDFSNQNAWSEFLKKCFSSEEGRIAYQAYRHQKEILKSSDSKMESLWHCILKHRNENIIIFTDDNQTAYKIGKQFMLPVITHLTKSKERKLFLENFKSKTHPYIVTSKVLNEGVDVPEASVGIIVSGSGSIREHVQRLGRILRHAENKQAILYELISKDTGETHQSRRRRQHRAYQRSPVH